MADGRNQIERAELLSKEKEELSSRLAEQEERIAALTVELAETNQGVVALYAELDDQAVALKEASVLKSRFLSYMSHEFRTPLASIRSMSRILLDQMDGSLTAEQEKQVTFMQKSALELTEMVDDLLDLAKIEAGRLTISAAWFEMVDLFAAIRGMFKPILDNPAVSLILEEPHDVPRVFTDHKKLSHILRNFISNALKFTRQGEVRVKAEREGENQVTFSVSDTGIGIAKEHQAAIFQDFVQVDSPIQQRFRGVGLGLSLSKKFALALGGSVSVSSQLGVGSTFIVTIPIHFQEQERGQQTAPAQDAAVSPSTEPDRGR
jgi:signal transduction histidine kinase